MERISLDFLPEVRTREESSRGRCGGVFREQSTEKGGEEGEKSEKKKKTKSVSKIKEHLHAPLRGVAMVLGRFLSLLDTIFALEKFTHSGKKMEEG